MQWSNYQMHYEAQHDIPKYISMFYNIERLHSYLVYMSPIDYEQKLREEKKAT
jgi:hypothetical protein